MADAMVAPINVGVVGCGVISGTYLEASQLFSEFEIVACTDLDRARAEAAAATVGARTYGSLAQLLGDPEIEVILNLTPPALHAPVTLQALMAGKSVYGEKPLAIERSGGKAILEVAASRGLRVGSAPDTFLGSGFQTARRLLDEGVIGEPIAATAFMMCRGHECWHPKPDFYYQPGGGPMFDMGPYYLTALVSLLGPIRVVTALQGVTFPQRVIGSGPRAGEVIPVRTPTYVAGVFEFATGAIGTIIVTFDVWASSLPPLEVYGSGGTLSLPDPNQFQGTVRVWQPEEPQWEDELPAFDQEPRNRRGLGLADMARGLRRGHQHRATGELAYHVLDVMQAFSEAAESGTNLDIRSRCERPAPLPDTIRR